MPSYSGVWTLPAVYQAVGQGIWPYSPTNGSTGLFGGGENNVSGSLNVINRITIESTGNATDFGDLTVARYSLGAVSSSVRGVWGGGRNSTNVIDYVSFSSAGNATDFGDLTQARYGLAGGSNYVRGVFGGGYTTTTVNTIDYITIASTGNATDFGDTTVLTNLVGGLRIKGG